MRGGGEGGWVREGEGGGGGVGGYLWRRRAFYFGCCFLGIV